MLSHDSKNFHRSFDLMVQHRVALPMESNSIATYIISFKGVTKMDREHSRHREVLASYGKKLVGARTDTYVSVLTNF